MSAAEETIQVKDVSKRKAAPIINRVLDFLSSVRFGVVLLCVLVGLSMVGMLIMQQNVQGFESYYASLTPAEKLVFGHLGLFDVYYSWYFKFLLLVLSLNIVLASIDRFPTAWSYIVKPKVWGTKNWLLARKENAAFTVLAEDENSAAESIRATFKENGLRSRITTYNGNLYVFGESGKWNRLGAYIVHVALLTLFLGHFVALQTGFDADVRMTPGETTDQIQMIQFDLDKKEKFNVQLPFTIECTDIQQKLIDPNGSIDVTNTLDWRTQMRITDPDYGETLADVSMNKPLSYRGYRFFQAQTVPIGNARAVSLQATPQNGGEPINVEIPRGGTAALPDGTKIVYEQFLPDFTFNADGRPDTRSGDYNNPAAVLSVTPPQGESTRVFAFASKMADNIPVGAPKAGYKWRLSAYEKSPLAHVLSIKYDPFDGALIAWYFGGFGLIGALIFVFFISHKRVWALIEKGKDGGFDITVAGEANRNHLGFKDKFNKIVNRLGGAEPEG
jgi:cytochrome c biogenesis protein